MIKGLYYVNISRIQGSLLFIDVYSAVDITGFFFIWYQKCQMKQNINRQFFRRFTFFMSMAMKYHGICMVCMVMWNVLDNVFFMHVLVSQNWHILKFHVIVHIIHNFAAIIDVTTKSIFHFTYISNYSIIVWEQKINTDITFLKFLFPLPVPPWDRAAEEPDSSSPYQAIHRPTPSSRPLLFNRPQLQTQVPAEESEWSISGADLCVLCQEKKDLDLMHSVSVAVFIFR